MEFLDAQHVLECLQAGTPLVEVHVHALDLRLVADNLRDTPLTFRRCRIDEFNASSSIFDAPVDFEQCHFGRVRCDATYFHGGAHFLACRFDGPVSFACAGHNELPHAFVLNGCTFHAFVDFFDGWYPGPVDIRHCRFLAGTNVLTYVASPFGASAAYPPLIVENAGVLDMDDETTAL